MTDDLISRKDAINAVHESSVGRQMLWGHRDLIRILKNLPSTQPTLTEKVEDILTYLDTELHPIVSPEHWNVYSELYDMINTLPSALPDRKVGKWIEHEWAEEYYGSLISNYECLECKSWERERTNYCPNCGARMEGSDNENNT